MLRVAADPDGQRYSSFQCERMFEEKLMLADTEREQKCFAISLSAIVVRTWLNM